MQSAGYATRYESMPATHAELDERYGAKVEEMLASWRRSPRTATGMTPTTRLPMTGSSAKRAGRRAR
jgi:hypothetical protein